MNTGLMKIVTGATSCFVVTTQLVMRTSIFNKKLKTLISSRALAGGNIFSYFNKQDDYSHIAG